MYKRIMVPTQALDAERPAFLAAVRLAGRFGAELRLVEVESDPIVLEGNTRLTAMIDTEARLDADRLARRRKLEALGSECRSLGVPAEIAFEDGPVGPALTRYAEKNDVDLIVMPSHGRRGVARMALGSTADFMIRNTHVPVIVVKSPATFVSDDQTGDFARILVPLDGSVLSEQILPPVEALASRLNATVSLLQVLTPFTYSQHEIQDPAMPWWETEVAGGTSYLSRVANYLTEKGLSVQTEVVIGESIPEAILQYVNRARIDLIAIATSGTGGFRRMILGSVADALATNARTSLLIFHPLNLTMEPHEKITPRFAVA